MPVNVNSSVTGTVTGMLGDKCWAVVIVHDLKHDDSVKWDQP